MTILARDERSVPLAPEASANYSNERSCRLNDGTLHRIVARRDEDVSGREIAPLPFGMQNRTARPAGISGTPAALVLDEARLRSLDPRRRNRIDRNAAGWAELLSSVAMSRSDRCGWRRPGPAISDGAVIRRDGSADVASGRGRFVPAGLRADAGVRS